LTLITLAAVRLLVAGVANALYATPTREKSIGDFLRAAGAAGATAFVARALNPAWRGLVF